MSKHLLLNKDQESFLEDYKQDEDRDTAVKGWVPQMSTYTPAQASPLLVDPGLLPWVK